MNDKKNNTFVRIQAVTLSQAKQALKHDQYTYAGTFPKLAEFVRKRTYVPTLPKRATLLYLDKYIILIDCTIDEVRIDVFHKDQKDIIYQILWYPLTDEHRFYCTLENGLHEQRGIPINYSKSPSQNFIISVDFIIQKNQRETAKLAKKIVEEVRLFFYLLENHDNYIKKPNKKNQKNVICLDDLSKKYEVVREHSKNMCTTVVAPYLRKRHPH